MALEMGDTQDYHDKPEDLFGKHIFSDKTKKKTTPELDLLCGPHLLLGLFRRHLQNAKW
jgi:hypothetical protein